MVFVSCFGNYLFDSLFVVKQALSGFAERVSKIWKGSVGVAVHSLENRNNSREWRLIQDDAQIGIRLESQLLRAMYQMQKESPKPFKYVASPKDWDMHEEKVGGHQVGISHAQGRRLSMEDEHLAVSFDLTIGRRSYPIQLFGIFDGHGGRGVASYVKDHLQRHIEEALVIFNREKLSDAGVWRALKIATVRLNKDLEDHSGAMAQYQGATATIAMILDQKLWTANVGDARGVIDNNGVPIQMTEDAKPSDERYRRGIEKRGGFVQDVFGVPRVNGQLAVARAIGDHSLGGSISARAKVTMIPLEQIKPSHHFVLCCDGIYDVARTQDVVAAIHDHKSLQVGDLARNIVYSAYQAGSTDNLSCMVIRRA